MTSIEKKNVGNNLITSIKFYIDKILTDAALGGMKVLLLDSVTTKIISMVYSQTQILEQEVYLVEQLGKRHESMKHFKAAVFVQPTEANFELLKQEISDPKFSEYHLFFSNIVPNDILTGLGKADEHEVIRQVQEYYADFLAVDEDFFHLGVDNSLSLSSPSLKSFNSNQIFDRNVTGLLSLLLALKTKPSQIRYQSSSDLAMKFGQEISDRMDKDDVFDFRRKEGPLLLILDRRDDPVTPLLTQWTYQAMVHELLGINNNRVILRGAPGIKADLEEVVLSSTQDEFFAHHRLFNFGDLGTAVKAMLDDYQRNAKMNENITSIEDMQSFMERYPAFRSHSINVSKHVAVITELARLNDVCDLFDISQLEQEISCSNDHSSHFKELLEKISNPKIQSADKLRLSVLFVLRYESYDDAKEIKARLFANKISSQQLALLDLIIEYAGDSHRASGLFSGGSIVSKLGKVFSSGLNGVENVYTQHQPVLSNILESISKGKLKDSTFPVISGSAATSKPNEVIIFIVGGATYEESCKVSEFNASNNTKVILGGSCIHNSTSFLKEIYSLSR